MRAIIIIQFAIMLNSILHATNLAYEPHNKVLLEQADTNKFYYYEKKVYFIQQSNFSSLLIVLDSLTRDTIEFDKQISQNRFICYLYENNKPKYKIYCKTYYDSKAKKIIKEEHHHNFVHKLPRIFRFKHKTCFFPTFNYKKSTKITRKETEVDGIWKKSKGNNFCPLFSIFDSSYMLSYGKGIRSHF